MEVESKQNLRRIITLEEGWASIEKNGIKKLEKMIEQNQQDISEQKGDTIVKISNEEFAPLYSTVYDMCIQKDPHCYTPQLYDRFASSIRGYLQNVSLPAITSKHGEFLLREFVLRWENHKIMQRWMQNIFRYIDKFYVKRTNKKHLTQVSLELFHDVVFQVVKPQATAAVLALVEKDRNGSQVDRNLLKDALHIYVEMGMGELTVYVEGVEKEFLQQTERFYSLHANSWVESDTCSEYLKKAEGRIEEEKVRLRDYLHGSTEDKLLGCLYEVLLTRNQSEILGKDQGGYASMLKAYATADLSRLYRLYSRVPSSLDSIGSVLCGFVREEGFELIQKVNADKDHSNYITDLMTIHERYYELVMTYFKAHTIFQKALKDAFESIVNKPMFQSSASELLAVYTDRLLKKGTDVRLSEQALQETLDRVVRLFSYLLDKDMFSEFYRKSLSKRLLLQRSASMDAEQSMIGRLKVRCGAQFTSKLEGMVNDMKRGSDHAFAFTDFLKTKNIDLGVEFRAQVLTTGFWPTYQTDEITVVKPFSTCIDMFKVYYNTKTSNRRLRWIHSLGVVTMAANFEKKRIDLVISTVQASLLLLFNENEELEIRDMIRMTGLTPEEMKKYLRSLVSGQYKVLKKAPADGYKPEHKIMVNKGFNCAQRRIRIPHVPNKSKTAERKTAHDSITEDRKHATEANIVRVMKARKSMKHSELVSEVSQQLMQFFRPDPKNIKKRIEDLIVREYLERDQTDNTVYHYLA